MKVLTAAQMRAADRKTIEAGIPGLVLMENAGHRVVEFLERRFAPLAAHRVVVLCGKGNNGGDGMVIARQLYTRLRPKALDVVVIAPEAELQGEAGENFRMLRACGCGVNNSLLPEMRAATLVIDALLGTGLDGPPREPYAGLIREIRGGFPLAKVIAVDIPSGLASDCAATVWEHARADHTVTFTAPQPAHVMEPGASSCGELVIAPIGTPPELCQSDLNLAGPEDFAGLFSRRAATAHKGDFGHVLVAGGSPGKTGAAAMAGLAALRAGAGLVTVSSSGPTGVAELMTEPLRDYGELRKAAIGKTVVAIGPGLGTHPDMVALARRAVAELELPMVVDADGLNALAGAAIPARGNLILTPHPGEMSRLCGRPAAEIQQDRVTVAREFAMSRQATVVLKGRNTLTAFPDGQVWINPTGGPAMATGGTGDILTGLIAGLVAQFPSEAGVATVAAVWLHGRAGDLAARQLGEKCVIATDLLKFLPAAMEECANLSHSQ